MRITGTPDLRLSVDELSRGYRRVMLWTLDEQFGLFVKMKIEHLNNRVYAIMVAPKPSAIDWSWGPCLTESIELVREVWHFERFATRDGRRHWIMISPDAYDLMRRQGIL